MQQDRCRYILISAANLFISNSRVIRVILPGAIGAIVGSDGDVAEKLPLGLLTARLCKVRADDETFRFRHDTSFHKYCVLSMTHKQIKDIYTSLFST